MSDRGKQRLFSALSLCCRLRQARVGREEYDGIELGCSFRACSTLCKTPVIGTRLRPLLCLTVVTTLIACSILFIDRFNDAGLTKAAQPLPC